MDDRQINITAAALDAMMDASKANPIEKRPDRPSGYVLKYDTMRFVFGVVNGRVEFVYQGIHVATVQLSHSAQLGDTLQLTELRGEIDTTLHFGGA